MVLLSTHNYKYRNKLQILIREVRIIYYENKV